MKLQLREGETHTAKFYTIHQRIAFFDTFPLATCRPKSARAAILVRCRQWSLMPRRPESEMQILDKLKPVGLLLLRLGVAAIFLSTGYDKLFGAPGKWLAWFPKQGFPPSFAYIAGSLEFFGGILLVLGLMTRFIGLLLAIQMGIAVWKVSLPHSGIHNVDGYGLPLMLGLACFALTTVGAGLLSVDGFTFERNGKAKARA